MVNCVALVTSTFACIHTYTENTVVSRLANGALADVPFLASNLIMITSQLPHVPRNTNYGIMLVVSVT